MACNARWAGFPGDVVAVRSTAELMGLTVEMAAGVGVGSPTGFRPPTYVVVGTPWENAYVAGRIAEAVPFGVKACSFDSLVDELSTMVGTAGDERVGAADRPLLAERAAADALGMPGLSPSGTAAVSSFMARALASGKGAGELRARGGADFEAAAAMLERYRVLEEEVGVLDECDMLSRLVSSDAFAHLAEGMTVIAQSPSTADARQPLLYTALARAGARVALLVKDYSPGFPLPQPDPSERIERFVEVHGRHALPTAIASEVEALVSAGASPGDIVVAFQDPADAFPYITERLATRLPGIDIALTFLRPVSSSALGNAYAALAMPDSGSDSRSRWEAFVRGPYSGLEEGACKSACLAEGVFPGADALRQRLGDLIRESPGLDAVLAALGAPRQERAAALLAALQANADALGRFRVEIDDERVADKVVAYAARCARFGIRQSADQFRRLKYRVHRVYGKRDNDLSTTLLITSARQIPFLGRRHVLVCDMDFGHHCVYRRPGALTRAESALGAAPDPWEEQADDAVEFRDILDAATSPGSPGTAVFVYEPFDDDGAEQPPAPMYSDLLDRYGRAPEPIVYTESDDFAADSAKAAARVSTAPLPGGVPLPDPTRFLSLRNDGTERKTFSPTELESYWQCPRKWFLSGKGAGFDEPESFDQSDRRMIGTLVHKVMETALSSCPKDGDMPEVGDIGWEQLAEQAIDGFVSGLSGAEAALATANLGPGSPSRMPVAREVAGKSQTLYVKSRAYMDATGFRPARLERRASGRYAGFDVAGRPDRVDLAGSLNDDGSVDAVVIDYKGGLDESYRWKGPRSRDPNRDPEPGHIQGAVYASLLDGTISSLAGTHLEAAARSATLRIVGIVYMSHAGVSAKDAVTASADDFPVEGAALSGKAELDAKLSALEERVTERVGRMRDGFVGPDMFRDSKSCSFCPEKGRCRQGS